MPNRNFITPLKTFSVNKEITLSPGMKWKSSKNNSFLGKRKKTFKDNVTTNEKVQFLVNDKSNNSKTEKAKTKEVRAKPSSAKTVREITKSRVRGREKTRRPKTQPASKLKLPEKEIHQFLCSKP